RTAEPFLDLRLLGGNLPLLATFARNLLTYTVSYAFVFGYTQWLEQGRGLSPSVTGLVLLPTFLAGIAVSALTRRRPEVRGKLLVGSSAQLLACAALLLFRSTSPIWLLVALALVVGVPGGLNGLANQAALYHQADPARIGSSAGLLRTFMYLGAIVAAAAAAAVFPRQADTPGLHHLAWFLAGVAALLFATSLADRSLRRTGRSSPAVVVATST